METVEKMDIKELTKQRKHLMKALHDNYGYDFNKPYTFYRVKGKFTMRKLEPFIHGYTVIMITIPDPNNRIYGIYDGGHSLNLVRYNPNASGKFSIDCTTAYGYYTQDSFNDFYIKSDFETMRKSGLTETYILSQDTPNMNRAPAPATDLFTRYKVTSDWGEITGTDPLYRCNCKPYEYNVKGDCTPYSYNTMSCNTTIADYFDKSGYCIYDFRCELQHKVREIKAQKAKDEYLKTDNSDKVATLDRLIMRYKKKLADLIMNVADYDDARTADKWLGWQGLSTIMDDYADFKDKTESKSFNSIGASDALYDRINKKIYEFL